MLGKGYITIDGMTIPNPISFSKTPTTIETVTESEAGTDLVNVVRFNKLSVSCSSQCTSYWADRIEAKSQKPFVQVVINNKTITARVRDFSSSLAENSEMISGTDGLWNVSFKILEI